MIRAAQLVYILFFSVLYGAVMRGARPWRPFATHFFLIEDPVERRAAARRLAVGFLLLNVGPFGYFAVTLYLLGRIHGGGGWLMLLDYFCVPWIALAVVGFYHLFLAVNAWGKTAIYGAQFHEIAARHLPHSSPVAYLT